MALSTLKSLKIGVSLDVLFLAYCHFSFISFYRLELSVTIECFFLRSTCSASNDPLAALFYLSKSSLKDSDASWPSSDLSG